MKKIAIYRLRTTALLVMLALVISETIAQDSTNSLSLQECVEIAFRQNLELKQAELQSVSSQIDYRQSRQNLLPIVNGIAEHGLNQGRSIDPFTNSYLNQNINYANYGLSGGVVLFSGLVYQQAIKQQRYAYEAAQMDVQQQKDNLTLQIIVAYLQVLSNEDQLVQINRQVELSRRQVERLKILNDEGTITPSEYTDLKGQLANDEVSLVNTKNLLEAAKLQLAQLMNQPYDTNLSLERIEAENFLSSYQGDAASIYQVALQQLAIVKGAVLRTQSAEQGLKARKGALWPTLSLNAGLFTNYSNAASTQNLLRSEDIATNNYVLMNGAKSPVFTTVDYYDQVKIPYSDQFRNNYSTNINLSLRIPILNAMQNRNRISQARLVVQNASYEEKTTKIRLQQAVEQAWLNMSATYNRYNALLNQVAAFEESFRGTEARFNEGVLNSVDYLVAKNNLDRANNNLIIARYEYVLRAKILDYYQGKPLW